MSSQHKRPVTREGIALLIEDCERTSAALSVRPTPFQLEQATNFLVTTVPAALRNLEEQLETKQREVDAAEDRYDIEMRSKMRVQERLKALRGELDLALGLLDDEQVALVKEWADSSPASKPCSQCSGAPSEVQAGCSQCGGTGVEPDLAIRPVSSPASEPKEGE